MKTTLHEKFDLYPIQLKRSMKFKVRCTYGLTTLLSEETFTEYHAKRNLEMLINGRRHLVFVTVKDKGGVL